MPTLVSYLCLCRPTQYVVRVSLSRGYLDPACVEAKSRSSGVVGLDVGFDVTLELVDSGEFRCVWDCANRIGKNAQKFAALRRHRLDFTLLRGICTRPRFTVVGGLVGIVRVFFAEEVRSPSPPPMGPVRSFSVKASARFLFSQRFHRAIGMAGLVAGVEIGPWIVGIGYFTLLRCVCASPRLSVAGVLARPAIRICSTDETGKPSSPPIYQRRSFSVKLSARGTSSGRSRRAIGRVGLVAGVDIGLLIVGIGCRDGVVGAPLPCFVGGGLDVWGLGV